MSKMIARYTPMSDDNPPMVSFQLEGQYQDTVPVLWPDWKGDAMRIIRAVGYRIMNSAAEGNTLVCWVE